MNYSYNEDLMMAGIQAYRQERRAKKLPEPIREVRLKPSHLRTECKRGHPLNEENSYQHPTTGCIACKICVNECVKRYYQKNKERIRAQKRENYEKGLRVGRKPSEDLKFARQMGVTKRQVKIAGLDHLLAMKPEARAFMISQMKKTAL